MILQVHMVRVLDEEGNGEVALALYTLKYGEKTCWVGLLRKHRLHFLQYYDRKFIQVTCLFSESNDYDDNMRNINMQGAGEAFVIY